MTAATEFRAEAGARARELAPELRSIVLTHYPDAETLDLMRPGEAVSLAEHQAANRAVAQAMAEQGVAVLVQQAERGAFRRWADANPGAAPAGWRGREPLLRGQAAWRLLGLDPARRAAPAARGSGTPAERLMRLFAGEDSAAFERCAEALIEEGRDGVLEQAVRRVAQRYGEEAADELSQELLALAAEGALGPSGWAGLVALPVALPPGELPDAAALIEGFLSSGALPGNVALQLLPDWYAAEGIAALTPCQLRQALHQALDGQAPGALPPAAPGALQQAGFGVLVGLQLDWGLPLWEEVLRDGLPALPAEDAPPSAEEAARAEAFERWRHAAFQAQGGCVPLALVPLPEVEAEIADFLEEAGEQSGGLDEIRDFVEVARQEAPGEALVCVPRAGEGALHLALYTASGRKLDEISLEAERLPVPLTEMPALLEGIVPLAHRPPG
ncbi:hypothetical protein [Pseudoroseomonas cervicalis]|uniref:hypothetical protein n=1 Tax=Teichococcus cervicalis TaxID=204525 RepID=UPI0022F1C43F|nr:hypothetical protein [Pseudoroseomonas cervicalis]WBV45186.1 hypothetical protein PFY06_19280 [Pseudoroseomonas cervicalis]